MRFWDTGVLLHRRRLSRAGTGRRTVHSLQSSGAAPGIFGVVQIYYSFSSQSVNPTHTRSSLSVQGAINVTHPQSPLSPCLYNFVVLRRVIQWLIDWCLHLQCKNSEKSISFRFLFFIFCFSQCNIRLPCANTHKNISSEKRHCPANDWPEMCKGLETYIQWDNLCSADSEDCTVEVLCLNINLCNITVRLIWAYMLLFYSTVKIQNWLFFER